MRIRWQGWSIVFLVIALCVAIAGGLIWNRSRTIPPLEGRMTRLPAGSSAVYLDVSSLRQSGLLEMIAGQRVTEDADYRQFVSSTGFDYRNDLDSALVGTLASESFIVATGRFDWKAIKEHTNRMGGVCKNGLCRMAASTPKRFISYIPLHNSMIGMAVSADEWAVTKMQAKNETPLPVPDAVVWFGVTGATLAKGDALPAGTKLFAQALSAAKVITIGLHIAADKSEIRLVADCPTETAAGGLENQLKGVTEVFRKYLENVQQKPNPGDLSGVLTSGSFSLQGPVVTGRWIVGREFLETLLGGRI